MGKIDIRSIDFDDDEYYENEHYENIKRKRRKKNNNDKDFSNFRGSLVEGEKVTLISLNEQKGEVDVNDPFGTKWTIPLEFVHIY